MTTEFKIMIKFLTQLGRYFLLLKKVFSKPEKPAIYYKQTMREFVYLGLDLNRYNCNYFILYGSCYYPADCL